jgi:hypothetical protein
MEASDSTSPLDFLKSMRKKPEVEFATTIK